MKKPLLLIFNHDKEYFTPLRAHYDFISYKFNLATGPEASAAEIVSQLQKSQKHIDGVVGISDRTSIIASYIAKKLRLPGPSPQSVYRAQNKIAFTQVVSRVGTNNMPPTEMIRSAEDTISLPFPVFIRPVKGAVSKYAYKVDSQEELQGKISAIRFVKKDAIPWYNAFFFKEGGAQAAPADAFFAQPHTVGKQYTVDGYVYDQTVHIIGFTKSVLNASRTSFVRFDFPSWLHSDMKKNVTQLLRRIVRETGYTNAGFNMEFFVLADGTISVIEFNTRISPQFIPLFLQTYEHSPLEMTCQLALGHMPDMTFREKCYAASSFPLRVYEDQYVKRVPSPEKIQYILAHPHVISFYPLAQEGTKLSDYNQDSYSYRYAIIDIKGSTLDEIKATFDEIARDNFGFELEPVGDSPRHKT